MEVDNGRRQPEEALRGRKQLRSKDIAGKVEIDWEFQKKDGIAITWLSFRCIRVSQGVDVSTDGRGAEITHI